MDIFLGLYCINCGIDGKTKLKAYIKAHLKSVPHWATGVHNLQGSEFLRVQCLGQYFIYASTR